MVARMRVSHPGAGFTLLEAVVSLAILSVASIAALAAVSRDLEGAFRTRAALESAALAEDRLEAVRLLSTSDFAAPPDSVTRGHFAPPFEAYTWRTDIEPVLGIPGLYDVRIDVIWRRGQRPVETRIYRPGP